MKRCWTRWDDPRIEELRRLAAEGLKTQKIADLMATSRGAIYVQASKNGISLRNPKDGAGRKFKYGGKLKRMAATEPGAKSVRLAADHPAALEGRTLFPTTVVSPTNSPRVLVSGANQRKIGKVVVKGRWKEMPIFCLTLEERKTCPPTCLVWHECFAPETLILKSDLTWSRIDELKAGDAIVGFDEEPAKGRHRAFREATVEATQQVHRKRVQVRTDQGDITVTGDHLFLARRKRSTVAGRKGWQWLRADTLTDSCEIAFVGQPWEQDSSYDAGRVRGFVEGEGHVMLQGQSGSRHTRLGYAQRPGKLFDEINEAVARLGFCVSKSEVISGVKGSVIGHADLLGGWREVLRFLGRIRPTRLLQNASGLLEGHSVSGRESRVARVNSVTPVADGPVFQIATSTKTLIANGFLAHNCYGNNMHMARRHRHGPELEHKIIDEALELAKQHPQGFVVRLHILGDFYSVEYVELWHELMKLVPTMHVFGFTAHQPTSTIGQAILRWLAWSDAETDARAWIRFSGTDAHGLGSQVIDSPGESQHVVCPAMTHKTDCCGTCGLCWTMDRPVEFLRHGWQVTADA